MLCSPLYPRISHRRSLALITGILTGWLQTSALWALDDRGTLDPSSRQQAVMGAQWTASSGQTSMRFDAGLLENFALRFTGSEAPSTPEQAGDHAFEIAAIPELEFLAPRAAFDGFSGGALQHRGALLLHFAGGSIDLSDFTLVPDSADTLVLRDATGETWFHLDYIHVMLYPEEGQITLANMDLRISAALAARLGRPALENIVIGQAFIRANIHALLQPELLDESPDSTLAGTCSVPNWHDGTSFVTDVALFNIGSVQQVAREPGVRVAIAPSASLRNVGTADVPWYPKFRTAPGGTYPEPYDRDQHPFLVWALYRETNGVFEQVASSGLKHAFFAQNSECICAPGFILWAANNADGIACTDIYGVRTNDDPTRLGIREEVSAASGEWEQCDSMFAPDEAPPGPCASTFTGETVDEFDRRLVVAESELGVIGANYWLDAWYLVRDDVNIFNSMARVAVSPVYDSGSSLWTFSPGSTISGPAIDAWVAPGTSTANAAHVRTNTGNGQFSLAVKVHDLGGGNWRYVYALMNFDFDAQFDRFALPLPEGVTPGNFGFADADASAANDWAATISDGMLIWTAPPGAELDWGLMASFVFEAESEPVSSVVLLSAGNSTDNIEVPILALGPSDVILRDGFESADSL